MQKFSVDISSRGAPMVLYAAQGDTKSRFFSVAMFDSGVAYSLPSGAYVTVRFGAPGMPAGWYDIIQEPGGGSHPAVSVDGNVITAELAEQAVSVPGKNGVWLLVNTADGYQLASWGFDLFVEAVHGLDAPEATVYYNALAEQVSKTLANAQAAASSAAQAQQYAESINPVQFATATQGEKADTAVQSVNGQRGTTVTLTPATIGAADAAVVGNRLSALSKDIATERSRIDALASFIVVDENTDFTTVNNKADETEKGCILILRANVSVSNGDTFTYKISKVVGLGGRFTSNTNDTIINFYKGTIFECANYQLFDNTIIPRSTDFLNGTCIPQWWGVSGDGSVDVNDIMERIMSSSFKTIRFPSGTYVCHPTNKTSGRTLIFDNGAIIDGIVHVAYGSNLGASEKLFCQNTRVIGKVVSTLRVGGAMIDGLSMPDGIQILDKNPSFINQSIGGEPCGVHFHFGCKNIDIGSIKVAKTYTRTNGVVAYALAIDTEENEPASSNIYIKEVSCGENVSPYYDVMINGINNVFINELSCDGGNHDTAVYINNCQNINIKNCIIIKSGSETNGIFIQNSQRVTTENIKIVSDVNSGVWGYVCNNAEYVNINNIMTHRLGQGLRLLNSKYIFIPCHTSDNDTTPLAEVNSDYKALHRFTVN